MRGGIWTNAEDEVLKVAVMKYGKNQWARISSLLSKKTPKQCKARWYEWLDPSIRKTEWSREEEEKLLHLAKLMPSQWRTIAPLVGRTAQQCLEHYERLLDTAVGAAEGESSEQLKRLRPGEQEVAPETKPARPDSVDMDDDEKEMLSEARARLANTQGKKARRKARERLLEDAKRAAALQKRKEMLEAGLTGVMTVRRSKTGLDYNAEIPFERRAPAGLHNVVDELAAEAAERERRLAPSDLKKPETDGKGKESDAVGKELQARRQDQQHDARRKERGLLPAALERKLREQQAQQRANTRISLPAPQVTEAEFEQLMRQGQAHETARRMVEAGETPASSKLRMPTATPMRSNPIATPMSTSSILRTPRTAASEEEMHGHRQRLMEALSRLPAPKNEFEIVIPEEVEEEFSE